MKKVKPGMDGKTMRAMFMNVKKAPKAKKMGMDKAMDKKMGIKDNSKEDKKLDREDGAKPMIKPSHKGLLHKKLGVPQGQKIPAAKIDKALHSKSKSLRKEANFAKNFGK